VAADLQHIRPDEREKALAERRMAHDRIRVIGMLAIVVFILLLTFLRFGKAIPWSAR
jgi:hypothetical protein